MRKLGWFLVGGGVALALGCGGGKGGGGSSESAARTACRDNLTRLYNATLVYGGDNDDTLPAGAWMDAITPYLESGLNTDRLRCPSVPAGSYGYAFNSALLGATERSIDSPDETPFIFDVADLAKNVAVPYSTAGVSRHGGPLTVYASGRTAPESQVAATPAQQRATCLNNVKRLATGLILYSSDNDDRFPAAESGWTDVVTPYLGLSRDLVKCPAVPAGSFGYAMDESLLGVTTTSLASPATAPLVFDSNELDRDATTPFEPASPARHGGDNVAYADGHAKTLP